MTNAHMENTGFLTYSTGSIFAMFGVALIGGILVDRVYDKDPNLCAIASQLIMSCGLVMLIVAVFGIKAYGTLKKYDFEIRGAALGVAVMMLILFQVINFYVRNSKDLYCSNSYENVVEKSEEKKNAEKDNLEIRSLLQVESAHAQSVVQEAESDKIGWAYVGINFGQSWDEKYFDLDGDSDSERLPKRGDRLIATGSVHLREDHIRYTQDEGWVNSKSRGVVSRGDMVEVLDIKTIADGFHWVKVRKIKSKKEE